MERHGEQDAEYERGFSAAGGLSISSLGWLPHRILCETNQSLYCHLQMELQGNRGSLAGEGGATNNASGSTRESSRSAFRLSSREVLDGRRRLAQQACCA